MADLEAWFHSSEFNRLVHEFHDYYYMPKSEMQEEFDHFSQLLKDMKSSIVPSYERIEETLSYKHGKQFQIPAGVLSASFSPSLKPGGTGYQTVVRAKTDSKGNPIVRYHSIHDTRLDRT